MKAAQALYAPTCTTASGRAATMVFTACATSAELRSTVASAAGLSCCSASASVTPSRPALP